MNFIGIKENKNLIIHVIHVAESLNSYMMAGNFCKKYEKNFASL